MRMIISAVVALVATISLLGAGAAGAASYRFDFDDGVSQRGSQVIDASLDDYMSGVAGRTVDAGDAIWRGSSNTFGGSDAIFTRGYRSTLDFDIAGASASSFEIDSVSFEWGIYDANFGRDFGLDVYDDATRSWRNNIFEVNHARDGDTGVSGRLVFDDAWEVTRLRFHDNGTYDVGLDNLWVSDNRGVVSAPTPEPTGAALFGVGLLVAGHATRRRSS